MRVLLISDPNISEADPELEMSKGVDNMAYSSAEEESENDDGESEDIEDGESDEGSETGSGSEDDDHEPESMESNGPDSGRGSKKAKQEGERMAAAALCINIGSFCDPPDLPGLAHFLEHMVFMGSNKYPEENAFDEFLKV